MHLRRGRNRVADGLILNKWIKRISSRTGILQRKEMISVTRGEWECGKLIQCSNNASLAPRTCEYQAVEGMGSTSSRKVRSMSRPNGVERPFMEPSWSRRGAHTPEGSNWVPARTHAEIASDWSTFLESLTRRRMPPFEWDVSGI